MRCRKYILECLPELYLALTIGFSCLRREEKIGAIRYGCLYLYGVEAGIVMDGVAQVLDDWAIPSPSLRMSPFHIIPLCFISSHFSLLCRSS